MKKQFTLLTLLVALVTSAWADDVTLFTADFTNAKYNVTYPTTQYGNVTVDENGTTVTIQGYKEAAFSYSSTDGITCTKNNLSASAGTITSQNPNYFIGIPLTGVNGSITVTTTGDATKWYYAYTTNAAQTEVCARQQASANGGFTITGLTNSNVTLYICSNAKKIKTITINTPGKVDPSYTLGTAVSPIEVQMGSDVELSSLVGVADATFTDITSNNTSIATIDGTKVHPVALGATTITFGNSASANYNATAGNTLYINVVTAKTPTTTAFTTPTTTVNVAATVTNVATVTGGPGSEAISYSSSDPAVAKVNATTGEVKGLKPGTATITAIYAGNEDYNGSFDTYDITVSNAEMTATSEKFWKFSDDVWSDFTDVADGVKLVIDNMELVGQVSAGIRNISDDRPSSIGSLTFSKELNINKLSSNKRYIHFKVAANKRITVYARPNGNTDGGRDVGIYVGSTESSTKATISMASQTAVYALSYDYTGSEATDIYVYGTVNAINIYGIVVEDIQSTISATIDATYGWATFCSNYALDFTGISDLKAYIVTGHTDSAIDVTQMTATVPAGTPLLLEGATTDLPVAASSATDVSANKLKAGTGAAVSAETGKTKYALSAEGTTAVFKKIATSATIPVGKAYLEFNEEIAAPSLSFDFGGTTGINDVRSQKEDGRGEVYNLAGQRVAQPTKGLYIVNGKKMIVK